MARGKQAVVAWIFKRLSDYVKARIAGIGKALEKAGQDIGAEVSRAGENISDEWGRFGKRVKGWFD